MRIYTETPLLPAPPRMAMVIHPEWDAPPPRPPHAEFEDLQAKLVAAIIAEHLRMLGEWVSELEPSVVFGRDGLMLRLSRAGDDRIVVPSRLATLDACLAVLTGEVAA